MFEWGVWDMKGIDETGNRYGSLVVLRKGSPKLSHNGAIRESRWICMCDCGRENSSPIPGYQLRSGLRTRCNYCFNDSVRVPEEIQRQNKRKWEEAKRKDPEYRAKRKEYDKGYRQRPEVIERTKLRYSSGGYKEKAKWWSLENKYGLTKEGFETMISEQENKCGICGGEFSDYISRDTKSTRPHVDHCHTSGEVRGLLCVNCNAGLGQFKDSVKILLSAVEYLQ